MLRVGGGNGQQPEMPSQDFGAEQQPQGMPMDGQTIDLGNQEMGDPNAMPPMDSQNMNNNGDIPQDGQSEYDTNFDAGVEADEDEDPKKFIQQLTGKLSTTLNSYNTENGSDEGLNKYVAKMIVKQAVKGMDDKFKKDIIKAINTADDSKEDDNKESEETEVEQEEQPQEELQEMVITKKQLNMLSEEIKSQIK